MNHDEFFQNIYLNWQEKVKGNKWYFRDSFQSLLLSMSHKKAEELIPTVVTKILEEQNDYPVWETLIFLVDLHVHTKRLTMHPELNAQWTALSQHVSQFAISSGAPFKKLKNHFGVPDAPEHTIQSRLEGGQ
ncbi:hypothetical protein CN918_28145 [Priestia megaterium]|nr:hypothetical protein CN918_28145 [Priestia megaterium]